MAACGVVPLAATVTACIVGWGIHTGTIEGPPLTLRLEYIYQYVSGTFSGIPGIRPECKGEYLVLLVPAST